MADTNEDEVTRKGTGIPEVVTGAAAATGATAALGKWGHARATTKTGDAIKELKTAAAPAADHAEKLANLEASLAKLGEGNGKNVFTKAVKLVSSKGIITKAGLIAVPVVAAVTTAHYVNKFRNRHVNEDVSHADRVAGDRANGQSAGGPTP